MTGSSRSDARRARWARLLGAASLVLAGCGDLGDASRRDAANRNRPSPTIPDWAMHAKAQNVDRRMPLATAAARVITEMELQHLPRSHLPAEQLAAAAVQNLEVGRASDAALWLSLASYRYMQEWQRILDSKDSPAESGIRYSSAYFQLRKAELETYSSLDFRPQLRALAKFLRGEEPVDRDVRRRLSELFREGPVDEETFAEAVRQKISARQDGPNEDVAARDVRDAYLQHLHLAAAQKRSRVFAARALADTPLGPFSFEALRWGLGEFSARFCSLLADQLSPRRAEVSAFLADASSATRANAAVIMGMNPHPDQVPRLEAQLRDDKEPAVRLALAYALVRHGKREHIDDLVAALRPCPSAVCDEASTLLDWLPNELKAGLDTKPLARLANDLHQTLTVRATSTANLGDIAAVGSLPPDARETLLSVSEYKNRLLASIATRAIAGDKTLSRDEVLSRLAGPSPAYVALLARLAHVSTAQDLPLLAKLMNDHRGKADPVAVALIGVAAAIPGPEAEALLLTWFEAAVPLRRRIAARLMARPAIQATTVESLNKSSERDVRLLIRLITAAPDALDLLQEQLRDPDPDQRLFGIVVAGFAPDARIKDQLWRLVNFRDDHFYPSDALVRHAAMSSLLWIAIEELAVAHSPGGTTHPTLTNAPAGPPPEGLPLRVVPASPGRMEIIAAVN